MAHSPGSFHRGQAGPTDLLNPFKTTQQPQTTPLSLGSILDLQPQKKVSALLEARSDPGITAPAEKFCYTGGQEVLRILEAKQVPRNTEATQVLGTAQTILASKISDILKAPKTSTEIPYWS